MKKEKCTKKLEDRDLSAVSGGQIVVEETHKYGEAGDERVESKSVIDLDLIPVKEEKAEMP